MSLFKSNPFQPSEDTTTTKKKIRTVIKRISTRNEPAIIPRVEKYDRGARAVSYTDTPSEIFMRSATILDTVDIIPGMTNGFLFVLHSLEIYNVSQMYAEFLKRIGSNLSSQETLQSYYTWLKNITKDTIASETNLHLITYAMGKFVEKHHYESFNMDD